MSTNLKKDLSYRFLAAYWLVGLLLIYTPIVTLITYSFIDVNLGFTLKSYRSLFENEDLVHSYLVSLCVSLFAASVSTMIGGAAAISCFNRHSNKSKNQKWLQPTKLMTTLAIVPMLLPEILLAIGLLTWFVRLHVTLGPISLVLSHITFTISYTFLTTLTRAQLISPSIIDAAKDLGASPLKLLWCVQIPILKPALAGGWMLAFTLSFDDFLVSFFTSGPDVETAPLTIYGLFKYGGTPEVFAAVTLVFLLSLFTALIVVPQGRSASFEPPSEPPYHLPNQTPQHPIK